MRNRKALMADNVIRPDGPYDTMTKEGIFDNAISKTIFAVNYQLWTIAHSND